MDRFIIYIINPISGTRGKKDLQAFIEKETRRRNIPFAIFPSVASGDYSFLQPFIKENNATDIVVAGGDGTVSQVVESMMNSSVNFGIIPCGSGNGLAFAAGISRQPAKALRIIFEATPKPTDGFRINNRFACMLCGLGFDAKVAHDFAQQRKRGLSTYVKQVIRNFFAARSYTFDLQVKNRHFSAEAFFISIANSNQFGNNFTIAPKASLSDGMLDIVIASHQNKLGLLYQTFRQVLGKNRLQDIPTGSSKRSMIYFQTDRLIIGNNSEAPLHIDGDPAETPKKVEVEVMKKCFRLLRP